MKIFRGSPRVPEEEVVDKAPCDFFPDKTRREIPSYLGPGSRRDTQELLIFIYEFTFSKLLLYFLELLKKFGIPTRERRETDIIVEGKTTKQCFLSGLILWGCGLWLWA